jgi:hypothetical protein
VARRRVLALTIAYRCRAIEPDPSATQHVADGPAPVAFGVSRTAQRSHAIDVRQGVESVDRWASQPLKLYLVRVLVLAMRRRRPCTGMSGQMTLVLCWRVMWCPQRRRGSDHKIGRHNAKIAAIEAVGMIGEEQHRAGRHRLTTLPDR